MTEKPQRDVLKKSVAIIDALSNATAPLRFVDLVKAAGLPKSTSHRLLASLAREGLVDFDEPHQRYRLGLKILTWAAKTWNHIDVATAAQDEMALLNAEVDEQVSLAVLDGVEVVYVKATSSHQQLKIVASQVGDREPAHCTAVGKAILAHLPEAQFCNLKDSLSLKGFTQNTITDHAEFELEIIHIREQGFAFSDREMHDMVHGIAAPIFNFEDRVVGALNIWAPVFRIDRDTLLGWTKLLTVAALRISQRMGYTAST